MRISGCEGINFQFLADDGRLHVKEDFFRGFLWFFYMQQCALNEFLQQRNLSSLNEPFSFPQISFYSRERRRRRTQKSGTSATWNWIIFLPAVDPSFHYLLHTIFLYPWGTAGRQNAVTLDFLPLFSPSFKHCCVKLKLSIKFSIVGLFQRK